MGIFLMDWPYCNLENGRTPRTTLLESTHNAFSKSNNVQLNIAKLKGILDKVDKTLEMANH